jgi:predicted metal-dependent phosphoesterase TrpH
MMHRDPAFSAPGRFWRGNLHTHSTLSDGVLPPEEVIRRYRAEGYDFISLTDHFVEPYGYPIADTRGFRDANFTTLIGAELHSGRLANGHIWHVLAVGLPLDFARSHSPSFRPVPGQESGAEIAARAAAAGAFVTIAHPQWSGLTVADAASVTAAHAVEIYNHGCAVGCDRGDGWAVADQLLEGGRRLTAIATDDAHFYEPDHFGGWVMVKAPANTPEALLAALKAGHFYASQGPEIRDIRLSGDRLDVEHSAAASVIVSGWGVFSRAVHGASMTRTTHDLTRIAGSPYIRVTVVDAAGRKAWSNPIYHDWGGMEQASPDDD